jgi:hypothetical protein
VTPDDRSIHGGMIKIVGVEHLVVDDHALARADMHAVKAF